VDISGHFSLDFLAQLSGELDPRRAVDIVTSMPGNRVVEIAVAMAAAGEHVAMGRFVAHLDDATLVGCIEELTDEDMLRIVFVLEGKERLDHVLELVGLERTQRMLDGAESIGLSEEALDLRDHLASRQHKQPRRRTGG